MKKFKNIIVFIVNIFLMIIEFFSFIVEWAIEGWFVTIIIIALIIAWLLGAIPTF